MSFLQSEIHEQPQVLTTLLEQEVSTARRIAADLRARPVRYVIIAGRGASDNAARYGQYLLGAHNRLPVGLATPSLFSMAAFVQALRKPGGPVPSAVEGSAAKVPTARQSLESHLMAFAAEEARLKGSLLSMDEYRRRVETG